MSELNSAVDVLTYKVLARRTRPRFLEEMVGHTLTVEALSRALASRQVHHALLFSGPRGVGKTSFGRVLAKCLLCQEGISSQPCGLCEACRLIECGQYADFVELDAASHTKIEDTLTILERIPFRPSYGPLKIYLIDEVHMLSRHSFNALLKTLEEPPSHVQFILATTELEKIPLTIQSRCLHFPLAPLSSADISHALKQVLTHQFPEWSFEPEAVELLAEQASGSLRDGLTLLDRFQLFHKPLTRSLVEKVLLLFDRKQVLLLIKDLFAGSLTQVFERLDDYQRKGCSWACFFKEVQIVLHRLMLLQVDELQEAEACFIALAKLIPSQTLQYYFSLAVKGARELEFYATSRIGVDLFILRAASFSSDLDPPKREQSSFKSASPMRAEVEENKIEQTPIIVNHKRASDLIAAKLSLKHEKELALQQHVKPRCSIDQKLIAQLGQKIQHEEASNRLNWFQFPMKRQQAKQELQRLFCLKDPWAACLQKAKLPRLLKEVLWESTGSIELGVVTIQLCKRYREMVDEATLLSALREGDPTIRRVQLVFHEVLETTLSRRYQALKAKHIAQAKQKIVKSEAIQWIVDMFKVKDKEWIYLI